jgi:hypothetical protein
VTALANTERLAIGIDVKVVVIEGQLNELLRGGPLPERLGDIAVFRYAGGSQMQDLLSDPPWGRRVAARWPFLFLPYG